MDRRDALKAVGVLGLASVENVLHAGEQPAKPGASPDPYSGDQPSRGKARDAAAGGVFQLRRKEKLMPDERAREMLANCLTGRLATVGADGSPYVVPLNYVFRNSEIWFHHGRGHGHLQDNLDHEPRVCFEVDEPGEVYANGPTECNTSLAYRSVVAFGRIRAVEDPAEKKAFFDAFMKKYSDPHWGRPKGVYPRLDQVGVCAIAVERMTGKETPLPAVEKRWPAVDNTRKAGATP